MGVITKVRNIRLLFNAVDLSLTKDIPQPPLRVRRGDREARLPIVKLILIALTTLLNPPIQMFLQSAPGY